MMSYRSAWNDFPQCILCGRCLEVCPLFKLTAQEEISPRGKAFLLQNMPLHDIRTGDASRLASLCTGCARCESVCPQKINLPLRISTLKAKHPLWRDWIWSRLILNRTFFLPLLRLGGHLLPGSRPLAKTFAAFSSKGTAPVFKLRYTPKLKPEKSVLFPGCMGKYLRPDLEQKAHSVLSSLGLDLLPAPGWQCCGFPLGQAGLLGHDALCMQTNLKIWKDMGRPRIYVFCATCLHGLTRRRDLIGEMHDLKHFVRSVVSISEMIPGLNLEKASGAEIPDLIWHQPCHGPADTGRLLQDALFIHGLSLAVHQDHCCGLGGAFRLQSPKLSLRVARSLWQSIAPQQDSLCLTDCAGCIVQLCSTRPSGVRVSHWLELI